MTLRKTWYWVMSRLWTPGWTIHESLPGRLNDRKWTFVNLDGPEIANERTIGPGRSSIWKVFRTKLDDPRVEKNSTIF